MLMVLLLSQIYAFQNDWSGGPGVQGPVAAWGNRFWQSQNVNYSNPGILSLVAILWMFTSWTAHSIDAGGKHHYQGFTPFDIDGDGDKDLILLSGEIVRWYEFVANWTYIPHDIANLGTLTSEGYAGVWADDFDGDGDGDVVVADAGAGDPNGRLIFYRNNGGAWAATTLTSSSRSRAFSADFDGDGDKDILASNRSWWDVPGIWLYRNDGSGNFTEEVVWLPGIDVWRLAIGDLDGDLDPDFVATGCCGNGMANVFINDGSGSFSLNTVGYFFSCVDGMWLNDLDRDGDLDITVATYPNSLGQYRFEGLLNDGTGFNYVWTPLTGDAGSYTDGSIARDMDLDGLTDISGGWSNLGYFRQTLPFPTFTEYFIAGFFNSHWIYPDDADQISCTPDIDIFATREGEHAIYENRMVSAFAPSGWLESSILQLHAVADSGGAISWFGWGYGTCIPNDTAVALFWRAGNTVAEILAAPWVGPIFLREGTGADSVFLGTPCKKYFQYRIELRADQVNREIATQGGVWIKYTSCPLYEKVEETKPMPSVFRMNQRGDALVLELPGPTTARLSLYDATGRLLSVIHEGDMGPGVFEFRPSVPAGIYMAVYRSRERTATAKLLVK
ncbi:MAG: T9SS type A sorting domain-containing protein [candidate division WOR-3 bacterium]